LQLTLIQCGVTGVRGSSVMVAVYCRYTRSRMCRWFMNIQPTRQRSPLRSR
jgi:hypothetical protein